MKNLVTIGLLGILAGCATPSLETRQDTKINKEYFILPKIRYITEQQLKGKSYGDNKINTKVSYHDDFLQLGDHIFASRFIGSAEEGLSYFTLFADNLTIIDYQADGVEKVQVYAKNYDKEKGNIGNELRYNLVLDDYKDSSLLFLLQDSVLNVLMERYTTRKVSESTIKDYEKAKLIFLVKDTI